MARRLDCSSFITLRQIPGMRFLLSVFLSSIAIFSTAQSAAELAKHRLQYKTDLANNIKADTSKVDFFSFNKRYIISATVEILENQPVFKMTTSSGTTKDAQKYVKVTFRYRGSEHTLYGYQLTKLKESKDHADHFFIPFKDATTGKSTYEAGRYLDFTKADIKDGKLTIDFNKAYNPYCAFTDGYNCPVPPRENTLGMKVKAGEKKVIKS
jgi:uncharacterized protein (DUF1684 family)